MKSAFLSAMISGTWAGDRLENGAYFIDADPDIFEHVLRYLRHGTYPLFYSKSQGYNYQQYLAVLERTSSFPDSLPLPAAHLVHNENSMIVKSSRLEARYLQIWSLEKWISDKTYHKAVKISHRASVLEDVEDVCSDHGGHVTVDYYPA